MTGYRETLNLPRADFPMRADLPRREPEWLAWWEERRIYNKLRAQRRGRPVLLLHDGPPYSNAHIHMGTASNKIWKDAVVRSASILGFDSPYVPGWDNHGMPIEIQVSRELRHGGKEPDRLSLRKRCRAYAAEWVGFQGKEFERLGVMGEWEHPYLTMDPAFEAEILEAFRSLAEAGYVQRGLRSIHWCPTDRTALAEAEIEYHDIASPSIHVAFPLHEDARGALAAAAGAAPVEAVAWTTTPWTLPANLGLMVDPGAEYVVVETGGRRFLLAHHRLAAVAEALGWKGLAIVLRKKGGDLLGILFEGPWGRPSQVVDGTPYVSLDEGTGLVHTAPGHGKEDFAVGAREHLGVLSPVDEAGRFTAEAEPFVGRSVLEVDPDVIAWLGSRGRLLGASSIVHSYPHCWRCHNPVIFRATRQWFMIIDHRGHRERALEAIEERVRWEPPTSKNRIREAVRLRPDWCLSRQRSWGVAIPAVYCEACDTPLLDPEVMKRAAERTRVQGSDAWYELPVQDFLPSGFTCSACGSAGPFRKETDILDVWFDSGATHRAVRVTHPALEATWARARAEGGRVVYFEGPDQHRGWFNSSLMVGVGLDGKAPYTDVLTHGWVLDADGRAMHKSLGNVVPPEKVIARYGADILRWWALATDWRADVRIGEEIIERVADAYRKVRNTFRFLLGNLSDFSPLDSVLAQRLTAVDRVFAGHLAHRVARLKSDYEQFLFHRVADGLLDLCTVDLSAVYLDVAKDRLYTLPPDHAERRSAQTVLWRALHDLAIAASPILVATSEEVWQSHQGLRTEAESVHLALWPAASVHTDADEGAWGLLLEVRSAVNGALEPLRAAKRLATTLEAEVTLRAPAALARRLAPFRDELPGFLLVAAADVVEAPGAAGLEIEARRTDFLKCERCWTHRADVRAEGSEPRLCGRCVSALAVRREH